MQNAYIEEFIKRTEYYASLAVVNQLESGKPYTNLEPVVLICITKNHLVLKDNDLDIISHHKVKEVKTGRCYFKNLSYVLVELERFTKKKSELESLQDHWMYYFKNVQESRDTPLNLQAQEIKKAYTMLERFNWTKEELEEYTKTNLYIQSQDATLQAKFIEGKAEGEKLKQIEVVKKMLAENLPLDLISKCTGLSMEEIKSFR